MPNVSEILSEMAQVIISPQWRNSDGGWLRHSSPSNQTSGSPHHSDPRTSALALLVLLDQDGKQYQKQITEGIKFLTDTQHLPATGAAKEAEGGGWGLNNGHRNEVTATGMVLLAEVRYTKLSQAWETGENCLRSMEYARDWLINHHRINGGWSDFLHHASSASATCWVGLALRETLDVDELEEPAIKNLLTEALGRIEAAQYRGGWNETLSRTHLAPHALSTAQCIYLLNKLDEQRLAEKPFTWLKELQESREGSWPTGPLESPVETTAWAIMALLAGGLEPTDPIIDRGVSYLLKLYLKRQGGWPGKPGGLVEHETSLYACLALEAYQKAMAVRELMDRIPARRPD